MDIFAELEKLRLPIHRCEEATGNSDKKCHCGNHKHNKTLDGIIERLKGQTWIGLDMANKPDIGVDFTFENLERLGRMLTEVEKEPEE